MAGSGPADLCSRGPRAELTAGEHAIQDTMMTTHNEQLGQLSLKGAMSLGEPGAAILATVLLPCCCWSLYVALADTAIVRMQEVSDCSVYTYRRLS
jgi:hypothetical protein